MASAEREPITEVWGRSPQRGPGADPLVRGSGGEVPLKLKPFSFWLRNGSSTFASFSAVCKFLKPHGICDISFKKREDGIWTMLCMIKSVSKV